MTCPKCGGVKLTELPCGECPPVLKLTQIEKQRGWIIYSCPDHGDMLAAKSGLSVRCGEKDAKKRRCNKRCGERT